jgi:NitT/TauT family transport system ATP-binding protein
VQELIEVPVPRPRSVDQLFSPEFIATKARLEALIHPQEVAPAEEDIVKPHMIRFVNVADNVE